jgi:hypothetical protein
MDPPRSLSILQQCCHPTFPFAVPNVTSACGLFPTRRICGTSACGLFPTQRIWPQMRRRKGAHEVWGGCGGLGWAGTRPALLDRFGYAPGRAQALADAALLGVDVELGVLIKLKGLIQKLHLSPQVLLAPVPRQPHASRILILFLATLHMEVQGTAARSARKRQLATSNCRPTAACSNGRSCASLVLWCYGAILFFCKRCFQHTMRTCTPCAHAHHGHMHTWTLPTSMLCCRT